MFPFYAYESLESTNTTAKALARSGARAAVVFAREQTAGRGRSGHGFLSPKGGLYLSLLLRPALPLDRLTDLTALTAVAVCRAISDCCPSLRPRIKPVNDIRLDGRKVCGILVESSSDGGQVTSAGASPEYVIIGIGVNVATIPDVPEQPISSLSAEGADITPEILRGALLARLEELAELLRAREQSLSAASADASHEWADAYNQLLEAQ